MVGGVAGASAANAAANGISDLISGGSNLISGGLNFYVLGHSSPSCILTQVARVEKEEREGRKEEREGRGARVRGREGRVVRAFLEGKAKAKEEKERAGACKHQHIKIWNVKLTSSIEQ